MYEGPPHGQERISKDLDAFTKTFERELIRVAAEDGWGLRSAIRAMQLLFDNRHETAIQQRKSVGEIELFIREAFQQIEENEPNLIPIIQPRDP